MHDVILGIMIPSLNRGKDLLPLALEAFAKQTDQYFRFILIDNGHQNLKTDLPKTTQYNSEENLGVAGSWNHGLKYLFENYPEVTHVLSLSDDCTLPEDGLIGIRQRIASEPSINFFVGTFDWSIWAMDRECYSESQLSSGVCFDERFYPAYFEDNDFDWRMRNNPKVNLMYGVREMTPEHAVRAGTLKADKRIHDRFELNKAYYVEKWGGKPGNEKFISPFDSNTVRSLPGGLNEDRPLIIIGPSCSGKSTLINTWIDRGLIASEDVGFAYQFGDKLPSKRVYHYNLLRSQDISESQDITSDLVLSKLLEIENALVCILLVSKETAVSRMRERVEIELSTSSNYPAAKWISLCGKSDFKSLYEVLVSKLVEEGVDHVLANSNSLHFSSVENLSEFYPYDKASIQDLLHVNKFEYHSVPLPYGLSTNGISRNGDLNQILDENLEGISVLDIGSAYGYFSFEAESRGAEYVCGIENMKHRIKGAQLLKEIKDSAVNFVDMDISKELPSFSFDTVLVLNVVHHVHSPIEFLRRVSSICTRKLVIEYPTILDPKFTETISQVAYENILELPLIAVSLLDSQDQTFLFNDSALERILITNGRFFNRAEFFDSSHFEGRRLGIFYKD